jgi:hypothetical protein
MTIRDQNIASLRPKQAIYCRNVMTRRQRNIKWLTIQQTCVKEHTVSSCATKPTKESSY